MCQLSHICDFSLTRAACPIPGKHRWIPDGKVLPNRPALHLARIPRYSQSLCLSLPPTLPTLPVTRALCQLMSLSTHLPVAPGQSDINLLNTCNLFMADNNSKDIVQNLSVQVPRGIICRNTHRGRLILGNIQMFNNYYLKSYILSGFCYCLIASAL